MALLVGAPCRAKRLAVHDGGFSVTFRTLAWDPRIAALASGLDWDMGPSTSSRLHEDNRLQEAFGIHGRGGTGDPR
jgi:hypothetical protein